MQKPQGIEKENGPYFYLFFIQNEDIYKKNRCPKVEDAGSYVGSVHETKKSSSISA